MHTTLLIAAKAAQKLDLNSKFKRPHLAAWLTIHSWKGRRRALLKLPALARKCSLRGTTRLGFARSNSDRNSSRPICWVENMVNHQRGQSIS